jgi:hypothetical protein
MAYRDLLILVPDIKLYGFVAPTHFLGTWHTAVAREWQNANAFSLATEFPFCTYYFPFPTGPKTTKAPAGPSELINSLHAHHMSVNDH